MQPSGGSLLLLLVALRRCRSLVQHRCSQWTTVNPTNHNVKSLAVDLQVAARTLGLQLHVLHASTERDFDSAFAADVFFLSHSTLLGALSVGYAMPAIFQYRPFAAAGGLMSYGSDETEYYRLIGNYTGRILKGEKSSELPVQQATKVELIINLKTARALVSVCRPRCSHAPGD
jgi:putative tryptophan/tyrosine transport system substrate-binding protein